jgi:hypothetical protein
MWSLSGPAQCLNPARNFDGIGSSLIGDPASSIRRQAGAYTPFELFNIGWRHTVDNCAH